jgi:hypothetical protein
MDLGEIGWGQVDWIYAVQDRKKWKVSVNAVMNLRFPLILGKYRMATQLMASRVVCAPYSNFLRQFTLVLGTLFPREV